MTADRGLSLDKFLLGENESRENLSRVSIFMLGKSLNKIFWIVVDPN